MSGANRAWLAKTLVAALICYLAGLTTIDLAVGFHRLVADRHYPNASDLYLRWVEERNVARGNDPSLALPREATEPPGPDGRPPSWAMEANHHPENSLYPPWSFSLGMLFVPPLWWQGTRIWFGACNVVALCAIGAWSWFSARTDHWRYSMIVCLACIGMMPVAYCLSGGQYGIIVTGLLLATLVLSTAGQSLAAGSCLAFALLKPQLSALFVLPFLFGKQWKLIVTAALWLIAATAAISLMNGLNPIHDFRQVVDNSRRFTSTSQNIFVTLLQGVGQGRISVHALSVAMAIGCVVLLNWQNKNAAPMTTMFCTAAVFSLFWTYRKAYDEVLIVFLIAELARVTYASRQRSTGFALATLICYACFPLRLQDHNRIDVQAFTAFALLFGLVAILIHAPHTCELKGHSNGSRIQL